MMLHGKEREATSYFMKLWAEKLPAEQKLDPSEWKELEGWQLVVEPEVERPVAEANRRFTAIISPPQVGKSQLVKQWCDPDWWTKCRGIPPKRNLQCARK